jgi:hypothetical protein
LAREGTTPTRPAGRSLGFSLSPGLFVSGVIHMPRAVLVNCAVYLPCECLPPTAAQPVQGADSYSYSSAPSGSHGSNPIAAAISRYSRTSNPRSPASRIRMPRSAKPSFRTAASSDRASVRVSLQPGPQRITLWRAKCLQPSGGARHLFASRRMSATGWLPMGRGRIRRG